MQITNYITLTEAAKLCPTRPSTCAIWRWCRRGLKSRCGERIRLEHIRIGGRILTTEDNMLRFFKQLSDSDAQYFEEMQYSGVSPTRVKSESQAQRQASIESAEAFLDKLYGPGWKKSR